MTRIARLFLLGIWSAAIGFTGAAAPAQAQNQTGTSVTDSVDVARAGTLSETRLFFAPTARALGHGKVYIGVYELVVPLAAVGIGDRITMAGGVTINPGEDRLVYLAPKATFYARGGTAVAAGGLSVFRLHDRTDDSFGIAYLVGTRSIGSGALTGGLAYGISDGELSNEPAVMIGGEIPVGARTRFITENYVFVGVREGYMTAVGFRFVTEDLTVDFGALTFPTLLDDLSGLAFIPWLGVAYYFDR